ncbi:MAG: insulinase family protein [Gemmatimonadetes bacterium]|nr:insulinase family protein [Gemmatimonadota bacterium]
MTALFRNAFAGAFTCGMVLLAPAISAAQAQPDAAAAAADQAIPTDPTVRIGTLPNGLRYYIRKNTEPQKRAELRLVVNAGSVLEDDDQRGLAHLLEHMAFNGTRNFEKQELVRYLQSVGMRFGPDVNAYTSFDETVYMLTLPTDSARVLETGFQILEDWAHGISLDSVEVEKERGVVIEEWRLGQGAQSRMRDKQFPILFRGSRYAERLPIGTLQSLQTAKPSAVRRFYREWYRPDLMAVVAVGDFDPDRIEALIRQRFSGIARPANPRPRPVVPVPDHAEPLVAIATDKEASYTLVGLLYKQPVRSMKTVAEYRRSVVESLYNGMLNERFLEMTRRADAPFAQAFSGQGRFVRAKEAYQLQAVVPETGVERGLDALLTEAERVARHGFTATELERQKTSVLRSMERAYAEREKAPSNQLVEEYVRHFLVEEPTPGIAFEYELYQRVLPGITLAEVNALAREWLTDENRVVMVNAPDKPGVQIPGQQALLAVFGAAEGKEVTAYVDAVSDVPLLVKPARAGSVTSVREVPEVGVTEWRLSNGVRVLLKPTDFKADEILVTAYSLGGASLTEDRDYIAALTAGMIATQAAKLGELDPTALRKSLAGKAVQVAPSLGAIDEGINGRASPKDLETLFQLVHLYFTAAQPDTPSFEGLRSQLRSVYQNMAANPEQAFQDSVQAVLTQHHPRARPFTLQTVDQMDLNRSLTIYRDRFADAGDFTFTFVGNFKPEELRPLVESYLATLPTTGRRETWRDLGIEYPRGVVRKEVRRGVEPKSTSRLVFTGPFEFTRENLHAMSSLADILRERLRNELREELSATYGVSVNASGVRDPKPLYRLDISFGSAPERREELTARVLAQIDSLRTNPPSAQEVATVQEQQRRALETNRRQNGYWLNLITSYDRRGWDIREALQEEERVSGLDPRVIHEAARRYLDTRNYVHAWLVPETQGAPATPAR